MDAVQNNPDIEGSLRQEINNASEKLDSMKMMIEFNTMRTFQANPGTKGYIKIAVIKISHTYSSNVIVFEVSGRGWSMPAQLYVLFANVSSADPALASFGYTGKLGADIALRKTDTSTWALYVYKDDAYDSICLHGYSYDYHFQKFDITFPGDFVESLPAGAINPTLYP